MKKLSYSVVIRTLGNTGLKYKALLDSIAKQTIQPEEIIVAIPEGYDRESVNPLPHEMVLGLRRRFIWTGVAVQPNQFNVVRTL